MNFRKTSVLLLSVLLVLLSLQSGVLAETDTYRYTGNATSGSTVFIHPSTSMNTSLFQVRKYEGGKFVDDIIRAYCIDTDVYIKTGVNYRVDLLENVDYFNKAAAEKVRAIIYNSYPYISLSALRTAVGDNNITTAQAIAGTQLAIWHFTNDARPQRNLVNSRVLKVYDYLISYRA